MAESLLLPVVRAAAGKAADALVQTVTRMCGVDDDRRKLERQLLAVQCKLADAEVKSETSLYIKRWMKDFRTVVYEADDVLDDFQYEALRRQAQIGGSKTRKVLSHFMSQSPLLFRLIMSRKLNNVLEKINKLVEEMNKFGLVERSEPSTVLYRQTHSALDDSAEIFGRDDDKELVVKLLLDQRDQRKVHVLPIFGMGGLGKTTLAKMVYNDLRVQQHFQLNMWHCVSDNFDAIVLVKSVIELATNGRCDLPNTIELLRRRLDEVIRQKRFLLVLDDVWNEEQRKWEDELKPLLCSIGGPGSVIVVTCRSQQVASIMGTLGPHKLTCLSEDDSWKLFSDKAFSKGVEEQAELVTVGKRIVKNCKGLPLALKTMGGLMSSKQQVQEWKAIEDNNIGENVKGKEEILPILKLSYRHLASEMKQCFAFCAVFPKDYEMEKDILIQLWMANGFFQEEVTMDLARKGEFIFDYLVWRSFLKDVKVKKHNWQDRRSIVCKMHDLMHDLAKDVTDECATADVTDKCATAEELIQQTTRLKDVRHILIAQYKWPMPRSELKLISELFNGTTSLCTLLMVSVANMDLHKSKMMSLRALRYCGSSITNNQVINSKHLRYLDLSGSSIARLPDSVCMLYNLQTLRLNRCRKLELLPEGISAMRKLVHLYLLGCVLFERMPPNISLLNNLRTLTKFVVDTEASRGIEELENLCHLGNRLELYNLRKIKSAQNAKKASLHGKQNLSELLLCWGRYEYDKTEYDACNAEQVLESLAPYSKLKILEVQGYNGLEISQWMRNPKMFQCLRKLKISDCPQCKDVPIVWLSVSLEYLLIRSMDSLTTLCKSIEVEAEGHGSCLQFFPKLKEMILEDLPSLERWTENSVGEPGAMFPVLEKLRIGSCPKLESVPSSPLLKELSIKACWSLPISSLAHLTTLSELEYSGRGFSFTGMPLCSLPSLVELMVPLEDQQSQRSTLETLRNLRLIGSNCFVTPSSLSKLHCGPWECFAFVEELNISWCDELVYWPVEELQSLVQLRSLRIEYCNKLGQKGSSSEQTLPLPQLERLDMQECHSLLEIPKLPASLEELRIGSCSSLVALPSNLGELAKLRVVYISNCTDLKALPDGMDGLTSLERLTIHNCPGIVEFPQVLLQRLPTLNYLDIVHCPELERRCREGGEYFHLLSSIQQEELFPLGLLPSWGDSYSD